SARVGQIRSQNQEIEPENNRERLATRAAHAEAFGDFGLSLDVWRRLKESSATEPEQRPWLLLAARKVQELTAKAPRGAEEKKARLELIKARLAEAEKLQAKKPADAQVLCQDIIRLYDKDSDLDEWVARARTLLEQLPEGRGKR